MIVLEALIAQCRSGIDDAELPTAQAIGEDGQAEADQKQPRQLCRCPRKPRPAALEERRQEDSSANLTRRGPSQLEDAEWVEVAQIVDIEFGLRVAGHAQRVERDNAAQEQDRSNDEAARVEERLLHSG